MNTKMIYALLRMGSGSTNYTKLYLVNESWLINLQTTFDP